MFVEFESMSDNCRVWVYQSSRNLSQEESLHISEILKLEIGEWVTHGMPMKGSFSILHNRIILIAADQDFQTPSGCSIDSSTRWLKELGLSMNIDFFDRSIGYFEGNELRFMAFFDAKKAVQSGILKANTKIINHQVTTKREVLGDLTVTAEESFLKRHFVLEKV